MRRASLVSVFALIALGACTAEDDRVYFEGHYFPAKAKKVEDNRAVFNVVVSRAHQSLTGALAAGEYEGVRYCIENFGSSRIDWVHRGSGAEVDPATLVTAKETMAMQGECKL